ncbi:MAG: V-type ATPase 116kDa subunit family protein [Sphaerochaetaceae bacterium]
MKVFTVPMRLLTAVVIDEAAENVKKSLLSLGVLDFIKVSHLALDQSNKLTHESVDEQLSQYTTLRSRLETLFQQGQLQLPPIENLDPTKVKPLDIAKIDTTVDKLSQELSSIREQQRHISQSKLRLEEMLRYLNENKLQYLDLRIGKCEHSDEQTLENRLSSMAHILLKEQQWEEYILLTFKRDRQQVNPVVESLNWIESPLAERNKEAFTLVEKELALRLENLEEENRVLHEKIKNTIGKKEGELAKIWADLKLHELLSQITSNFSLTRNTVIFSGWVPASNSEKLENAIQKASRERCVIEWTDTANIPREKIPVAVEDVPLLRPFQKIVDNYSTPEYGTINPTPFVALSYLAMFGLMFADAGQGVVIFLIGLLGKRYYKDKKIEKPMIINPDMYNLFIYLGLASVVSGVIFGSYFGYPLFKALWFNYHEAVVGAQNLGRNVYTILKITIWFGIIIIGLGLILNWINLIRKKDYYKLLMDKNGILGGWIFGCGVWVAFAFVASGYKTLPSGLFMPLAFALPLTILLAKLPLGNYLKKKKNQEVEKKGIGTLVMDIVLEWIVDVLEIFSGFLANTLSFMRVAGLGIAHASLMTAFMEMAGMTKGVFAILILILGNVLVIALEGLSAGIQALRLNYYEFFTKYFTGGGLTYNPIALQSHAGKEIRNRN